MTTLLQAVTTIAKRCGLTNSVSSVIGSTNNNIISILTKLEEAGKAIRDYADWPELQKIYTFSLATDTAGYALPADFDRMIDQTQWSRSQVWPLYGPITPEAWQFYKSGLITLTVNQRFRVFGWSDTQFNIDPTPDSGYNGDTCAYEYISKTWIRPRTWTASTSWSQSYCSYDGNIYTKASGSTTGTSAPVHTSGSASDGGISWTYSSAAYETFIDDTDQLILDDEHLINSAVWRWKMEKGFPFEPFMQEAMARLEGSKADLNGARSIQWGLTIRPWLDFMGHREGSWG